MSRKTLQAAFSEIISELAIFQSSLEETRDELQEKQDERETEDRGKKIDALEAQIAVIEDTLEQLSECEGELLQ